VANLAAAELRRAEVSLPVSNACFAVAGPVSGGKASLTNLPWLVDESALEAALGIESIVLLNDVEAWATAVPHLEPSAVRVMREGEPVPGGAIAVIAPGTGLGEAFLSGEGTPDAAHVPRARVHYRRALCAPRGRRPRPRNRGATGEGQRMIAERTAPISERVRSRADD
jgi:hypothetical protein